MNRQKFMSLILAVTILCTCVAGSMPFPSFAAENGTVRVESGEGKAGEEVTVAVVLANNPGICTAYLDIHYDEGLTLTKAEDTGLLKGSVFGRLLTANPYSVTWDDCLADRDNTENGAVVNLTFKISEAAADGKYKIWVTYKEQEIYNLDFDNISFDTVDGYITVGAEECSHSFTTNALSLSPCLEVSSAVGMPGDTVTVNVSIADNPGIVTARLGVKYDSSKLQLISAEDTGLLNGGLFGGDIDLNPYTLYWDDSLAAANNSSNGIIAALTFLVLDSEEDGDAQVSVYYIPEEIFDVNLEEVAFNIKNGAVAVRDSNMRGDVDGDGEIGIKDALAAFYHISAKVRLEGRSFSAADLNGDGRIALAEAIKLFMCVAGRITEAEL